jgi:hypothetical protein
LVLALSGLLLAFTGPRSHLEDIWVCLVGFLKCVALSKAWIKAMRELQIAGWCTEGRRRAAPLADKNAGLLNFKE